MKLSHMNVIEHLQYLFVQFNLVKFSCTRQTTYKTNNKYICEVIIIYQLQYLAREESFANNLKVIFSHATQGMKQKQWRKRLETIYSFITKKTLDMGNSLRISLRISSTLKFP